MKRGRPELREMKRTEQVMDNETSHSANTSSCAQAILDPNLDTDIDETKEYAKATVNKQNQNQEKDHDDNGDDDDDDDDGDNDEDNDTKQKSSLSGSILTKIEEQLAELIEFFLYREKFKCINYKTTKHIKEVAPMIGHELNSLLENQKKMSETKPKKWCYHFLRNKKGVIAAFDRKRKEAKEMLEAGKPYLKYNDYLTKINPPNYTHLIPKEVLKRKNFFKQGDQVLALYPNEGMRTGEAQKSFLMDGELHYDVVFGNGNCFPVHEIFVQEADEYDYNQKYDMNQLGPDIGIMNWCSSNTGRTYEKYVGWWRCNENDKVYLTLTALIRDYDNAVVEKKKKETRKEDLQCPEDWDFDFNPPVRMDNKKKSITNTNIDDNTTGSSQQSLTSKSSNNSGISNDMIDGFFSCSDLNSIGELSQLTSNR